MPVLSYFRKIDIEGKFLDKIHIPDIILSNNIENYYDSDTQFKYGGYGIIIFYTRLVLKIISCNKVSSINKYIIPEIDGIKISKDMINNFVESRLVKINEFSDKYKKTNYNYVYNYNNSFVTMVLMPRYSGDIYKPIYNNIFDDYTKDFIFEMVIKSFIELLYKDYIYIDIKLEQILYKNDSKGKLKFKIGDIGSIINIHAKNTHPTYSPVEYAKNHNLKSIQLILFSLASLWIDLYKNHKLVNVKLSWKYIEYNNNFNNEVMKTIDSIDLPTSYDKQKELIGKWLTADLTKIFDDKYTNKFKLLSEFQKILSFCIGADS